MAHTPAILFINMAKGFGGGEFYTEQLITNLQGYECYFLGKRSGKLGKHLRQTAPQVQVLCFWQALKLVFRHKNLIIHALDGRGAHLGALLKKLSKRPLVITRQVGFSLKRQSSQKSYAIADKLVGVSRQISTQLAVFNTNTSTVYGCLKPLQENREFEQQWFSGQSSALKIAQIGNFQAVKNFPLTIALAKQNPSVQFYLVGSGELENALRTEAKGLDNVTFIPFTPYVGSVFKHIDLLIMPSHSEGMGMAILEAYQYGVPVLAHSTGGIPEIVEQGKTGYLVSPNQSEQYQSIIDQLMTHPELLTELHKHIQTYLQTHDFSVDRMVEEYDAIYRQL